MVYLSALDSAAPLRNIKASEVVQPRDSTSMGCLPGVRVRGIDPQPHHCPTPTLVDSLAALLTLQWLRRVVSHHSASTGTPKETALPKIQGEEIGDVLNVLTQNAGSLDGLG